MRHAARTDENHSEIVDTFRRLGCSVLSLASMGHGVPDLLIGSPRGSFLVEVKDGTKPPSARRLTDLQKDFLGRWRGHIYLVQSIDDVAPTILQAARDVA